MAKPKAPVPWEPAAFEKHHAIAIKALAAGTADEWQQKRAMEWILNTVCDLHGLSFRPEDAGGERWTAFAEGKRYVALQICKMININLSTIKEV